MSVELPKEERKKLNKRYLPQPKQKGDKRPAAERDRSRIIHSAAFRRLQNKTQVFGTGESDFYRTRLTHSMEVAQIGRGIVLQLCKSHPQFVPILPSTAQIEAICLAHDLGHPPFGHSGEIALNHVMWDYGGFEGNGQSLRIVTHLEKHTVSHGLNLTRRILLGILKYPYPFSRACRTSKPHGSLMEVPAKNWKPPKCYMGSEKHIVDWILDPLHTDDKTEFESLRTPASATSHGEKKHMSLDASIMTLADDIAYGVHDLEDGIALRLITRDHFKAVDLNLLQRVLAPLDRRAEQVATSLFEPYPHTPTRKQAVGSLIHALILGITFEAVEAFSSPLLRNRVKLQEDAHQLLEAFQQLNRKHILSSQPVQTLEYRGRKMIMEMFNAVVSNPKRLLDEYHCSRLLPAGVNTHRVVCDYIASMSDTYASRFYERLFIPGQGSFFERL